MSETQLKVKVKKYLKTLPEVWHWKTNDNFTSGIPDIIGCARGIMFCIELKAGKNTASPLQKKVIRDISKAGGKCAVCWTLDAVKHFMENKIQQS